MANQVYLATGQVIDIATNQGIPRLRVEAWDAEMKARQPLAATDTKENGRFTLSFDFMQMGLKTIPDITFKVFRDETLLEGSETSLSWNTNAEEDVTILVRKTPIKRAEAKDRVTTKQFLKGVDFVQESDFMGLFRSVKEKAGTRWSTAADIVAGVFTKMNFEPIKPSRNIEKEVVNKDIVTAKQNLESENIQVNEVLPFDPHLNKAFLTDIASLSSGLKPGQKINLYEEKGTVKYYSVVKETATADGTNSLTAAQADSIKKMEKELKASKEDSARKEEMINKLQEELTTIRKSQDEIQKVFKSKDFTALLKTIGKSKPNS